MSTRMRLFVSTVLLSFIAALPAAAAARTETREVAAFQGIALSAPIRVDLALGERESVVLEGDEAMLAVLETTVEDGTLRIGVKRGARSWGSDPHGIDKVRARVTARRIQALAIHGAGDIRSAALRGDTLAVSIAGSGDVKIDGGKVDSLTISISGSGDIKAGRLEARSVAVSIAGSGDATVWARESLAVKVAGSGDVGYYGDPTIARTIAGSGGIKRLGAAPA